MNTANASHKSPRKALVLCLLAVALSAAFLFESVLAQEGPEYGFVDLVMLYEQGSLEDQTEVIYRVQNLGNIAATGVTISFLLEDLEITAGSVPSKITDSKTVGDSNQTFTWDAGTILPGESSAGVGFPTSLHSHYCPPGTPPPCNDAPRIGAIQATASSDQFEPDLLLPNSVIKIYSYALQSGSSKHMGTNKLGLMLKVSDLRPDATGDAVDFTLTARNMQGPSAKDGSFDLIGDISINVELSAGLEFTGDGFGVSGSRSATWRADPVDKGGDPPSDVIPQFQSIVIKTQLTSDSLEAIPLEERCITAWVEDSKPPPSPGYALGSLIQCLGDDPLVLFESGGVELLSVYPCVGVTPIAYPCRDDNSDSTVDNGLEMVVRVNPVQVPEIRSFGIGRIDEGDVAGDPGGHRAILRPQSVLVQVKDDIGRNSSGSGVSWVTYNSSGDLFLDNGDLSSSSTWPKYLWSLSSVQLPTGSHLYIGPDANKNANYVDTNTKPNFPASGSLTSMPTAFRKALSIYLKFDALGTYKIDFTQKNEHSSGGVTSEVTASGRYTFHVGPIAELEVRDGGGNAAVPPGQRAYTIVAVNNGPDAAPAAKVTLTDAGGQPLPAASCTGNATKGSVAFTNGECVWTIGELIAKDALQITTGRDGEALTITSAAAGAEITAAISNTEDYEVCIDSSGDDVALSSPSKTACTDEDATNTWHTTDYYDYISNNNSASIASRAGIQGQATLTVTEDADKVTISWPEQTTLTDGSAVASYGLLVSGDGGASWRTLASRIQGTSHSAPAGPLPFGNTRHYAVYALNREGDRDLPFATAVVEDVVVRTNTVTRTETVVQTETVVETVTVAEDPFAYFAEEEFTRTVAENSPPGSPVGAPVAVVRNSGNEVAYSLEGPDAALFTIEQDTGQILVGEGTLLDYESDTTSYAVEVVADPSSGANVKTTVTISVVDVSETGFVFIDPAGVPLVGFPLFASLMHTEGEPVGPRWQWQRSMPDGTWADIPGAIQDIYMPTELDAGRRLRALVVFGNPRGDGEGLAGAVTERLPGEAQVIPTAGTGTAPEEVFGVLEHNLAAVWRYDNATQTWAVYSPWNPPELNDLTTVSSNDVVWMDIISEVQFQGNTLYPGWNLVIVN